jgi:hypothetical protein
MTFKDFVYMSAICIVSLFSLIIGNVCGQKQGYIDCLNDTAKNKKPRYILVEQGNRTTKWEHNEEYKYEP